MIKTGGMILFMVLSVWSLFGFEPDKPVEALRQSIAFTTVYPLRAISLLAFVITFVILAKIIFIDQTRPAFEANSMSSSIISSLDSTSIYKKDVSIIKSYIQIKKDLDNPVEKGVILENTLKNFIDRSRLIRSRLPEKLRSFRDFENSPFNFDRKTQIQFTHVEKWKHTIVILTHDANEQDKKTKTLNYYSIPPDINDIKSQLINRLADTGLDMVYSAFHAYEASGNSLYSPDYGFGAFSDNNTPKMWTIFLIPDNAENFDYNKIASKVAFIN